MNPSIVKCIAYLVLFAAVSVGLAGIHHHIFQQGVAQEKARRDKIDAANTIKAQAELAASNEEVRVVQAELTAIQGALYQKQKELNDAQIKATSLESDLRNSRKRMLARGAIVESGAAGSVASSAPPIVDKGAEVTIQLEPATSAELTGIAATGDSAIDRLNACVDAYDAVKAAADALEKKP